MNKLIKRLFLGVTLCLLTLCCVACSCNGLKMLGVKYSVSFDVDGTVVETQTVEEDETATKPNDPEKENCVFAGWYEESEFLTLYDFATPVTENITLYAKFTQTYAVTFTVDGEVYDAQTILDGEAVTEPTAPEKEKHAFLGWYTEVTFENAYDFTAPVTADVTLYAKFLEIFTLNFTVDGETHEMQTLLDGEAVTEPTAPEKEKHAFLGWYTEATFDNAYDFTAPVTADVTLYAKFIETFTVSFMIDGEVYETQTIHKGSQATEVATPDKDGYVFKKWCMDEGLTFTFDFATPIYEDICIYAAFSEAYKVTYADENGNTLVMQKVEKDTSPAMPAMPEKDGYKVKGVYLDPEFTNEYLFDTVLPEDTTLYVLYDKIITIYTVDNLKQIANKPDGFFRLGNDINLMGEAWTPIENFSGELDGNGYTIEYFTITTSNTDAGFVKTNNGVLKNITFEDVIVNATGTSDVRVGAIAGRNRGTVENCKAYNVVATYTINNASATHYLGGVIGTNSGTVSDCFATCQLTVNSTTFGDSTAYVYMGGFIGYNEGNISSSLVHAEMASWANVDGHRYHSATNRTAVAGFVGINKGLMEECGTLYTMHLTNTVGDYCTSEHWLGGFVQQNYGEINRSFAKGKIDEKTAYAAIGGFSQTNSSLIKDCYADCEIISTSNNVNIGGFTHRNSEVISSSYAIAKITAGSVNRIGGFVAANETNGTINACFAKSEIVYTNATNANAFVGLTSSGAWYEKCHYATETTIMKGEEAVEYVESSMNVSGLTLAELYTETVLFESLRWNKDIWTVDGVNPPALTNAPTEDNLPL